MRNRLARIVSPLGLLVALCILGGCAHSGAQVVLSAHSSERRFTTTFSQAYFMRSDDGSTDVVLVSDPLATTASAKPGAVLRPAAAPPIRQIVHIHVLWQPLSLPSYENPALTNASMHWYVIGSGTDRDTDLVQYDGSGFVTLQRSGQTSKMRIRTAAMRPVAQVGDLVDPIGPADLTGTILAERNSQKVQDLLRSIDRTTETLRQAAPSPAAP